MTKWIEKMSAHQAKILVAFLLTAGVVMMINLFATYPTAPTYTPAIAPKETPAPTTTSASPKSESDKAFDKMMAAQKAWIEFDPNLEKEVFAEVKYRGDAIRWNRNRNILLPIIAVFFLIAFLVHKVRDEMPVPE